MGNNKYSSSSIVTHWSMAVLIISMLYSRFYMKTLPVSNKIKSITHTLHKAFGITTVGLVVIRILRTFTYVLRPLTGLSRFESNVSKAVHFILYFLMVLMPASGYIVTSASSIKIKYLFHIPSLISKNKELASIANRLHSIFTYFMIFFITLHILETLKHAFLDKKSIIKRMI
ncbi:cytochrome B [Wolbachia endosymbiont of Cruorifilaria tuberocauda]|uniref:cytochrome b n=1 Tax=Wolbachia endosymbiont of Cruorifilaria tuberocauda TaxID=1812111 RepID=UPI00158BE90A|nr:cytochrome b [Wolbachia endosymbiont of Cruorifilaria tuberocauda]QKX01548.1 cytochrome B [Wolbachia endosymbiont of Cruorifilaria tuberocauda]